jgi:anti-anti-sigma factor
MREGQRTGEEGPRMEANIWLKWSEVYGMTLVELIGKADIYGSAVLRADLFSLINSGRKDLIIDLAGLHLIDASGLAVLIQVFERTSLSGGSLKFICQEEKILEVFAASGVDRVFPIHKSLEECCDGKG